MYCAFFVFLGNSSPTHSIPSTHLPMPMIATWVTDRLQKHTTELKYIATLPYDAFLKSITDINHP